MSIYTKSGDFGFCDVIGKRVSKCDDVIELLGTLDELNAFLGLAKAHLSDDSLKKETHELQLKLMSVMGEVAGADMHVTEADVEYLEALCDKYCKSISEFSVPGETTVSAYYDAARTIARRAERRAVLTFEKGMIICWLNRLSDVLFAMAVYTKQ